MVAHRSGRESVIRMVERRVKRMILSQRERWRRENMMVADRSIRVVMGQRACEGGAQSDRTEKRIERARRWHKEQ